MRAKRAIAAAVLAGLLTAVPVVSMAAPTGPGAEPEPERYTEAELARLQDNVLEYDEIELRIREYNPIVSEIWKSYRDMKSDYQGMITELESEYDVVKDMADGIIQMGQMMGSSEMVGQGKELDKSYRTMIKGIRETVSRWDDNKSATGSIYQVERQLTSGAQQALIGYDTIRKNMATLETMVQLYERQNAMYQRMQGLGLGTDKDVLSAQASLLAGRSQLESLKSQEDSVRRTVCFLLGFDPESNPDIRPVPEFDMSRLEAMNLEEDTAKAIGNNYTLISQRHSAAGKTNSQIETRLKGIEAGEQKLSIEMQRLYGDVMDKKAAYDAAATGFAAAEASHGASTRQYNQGLISEMQYIGTQISYYQKKAAFESANLALWQSMESYSWGVMGLAAVVE